MKSKATIFSVFSVFLVLMVLAFGFSGCSRLFAPSDEDAVKAISESGYFAGGIGGFTLQSPIKILEKGNQNKDGSWPVKVKAFFTVYLTKDQISQPLERTMIFNVTKAKDSAGKTIWKAAMDRVVGQ